MTVTVTPHLNFRREARAALAFYHHVFGGELVLATYADLGAGAPVPHGPEDAALIVWGQVAAADGFRIMAFDILEPRPYEPGANAFFVSLRAGSAAEAEARWAGLADGATILHPLGPAPWSPLYGMLRDRFGVTWVIDVAPAAA